MFSHHAQSKHYVLRTKSGSFAMFAAIRHARVRKKTAQPSGLKVSLFGVSNGLTAQTRTVTIIGKPFAAGRTLI
jgi:hypothetical protein